MGSSPRYIAEHLFMPRYLREQGAPVVLAAMEARDPWFFAPVWAEAGFRFTPTFCYAVVAPYRVGVMTLPAPREPTEAYMAAVIGREDDPSFLRYFLWETGTDLQGEPITFLCEWQGPRHLNHGEGHARAGELVADAWAFAQRALAVIRSPG